MSAGTSVGGDRAVSGFTILLFRRRVPEIGRSQYQLLLRARATAQHARLRGSLGYCEYTQIHLRPAVDPIGAVIAATRSAPALAFAARAARLPQGEASAKPSFDVVERFHFRARQDALRALEHHGPHAVSMVRDVAGDETQETQVMVGEELQVVAARKAPGLERILFCIRARPGLGRAAMQACWRGPHRALVASLQATVGYAGYEQVHASSDALAQRIADGAGGPLIDFDGAGSLLFPSRRALATRLLNPMAQRANLDLIRDELTFIDERASKLVTAAELPIYVAPVALEWERAEEPRPAPV